MAGSAKRIGMPVLAVAVIGLLALTVWSFAGRIDRMTRQENFGFLMDVAKQSAATVNKQLEGDIRMLEAMAALIGGESPPNVESWVTAVRNQSMFRRFMRVGIILPNGLGYAQGTSDSDGVDFSDRRYFQDAMTGKSVISEVVLDRITGLPTLTYATPIRHQDKVVGVLGAAIGADVFCQELFERSFMGRGSTYLVGCDGTVVADSLEVGGNRTGNNLLGNIVADASAMDAMRSDLNAGRAGQLECTLNGEVQLLCYVKLRINGWYVVSALPTSVVQEKSGSIFQVATLAMVVVGLLFLLFLICLIMLRRRNERRLYRMAYYDELTGLLNKNGFQMEAEQLLGKQVYVYCVLDIKRFRVINERFGYGCGDELLRHLGAVLRKHCATQERVSRFSGDSFHLLWRFQEQEQIQQRFQKIVKLAGDFSFPGDSDVQLQFGLGALVVEDGLSLDAMGDMAKLALGTIRARHATACAFYDEALQSQILAEQAIENDMNGALKNREFLVYLQPKYALESGHVASSEALVRWKHPTRGIVSPGEFIPLFEKNGFIAELDLYMFRSVCALLRKWIGRGYTPLPVSINQSRLSLFSEGHMEKLVEAMERYHIAPRLLVVEVTESAFLGDNRQIIDVVARLHALGFSVSMDDFGSGYSSLNMLKDIPIDELKIDKNFFDLSANRQRGRLIVRNIISMAQDLRIAVVAEGVETAEHVHLLRQTGCQFVQGYYFSKAIPTDVFEELAFGTK